VTAITLTLLAGGQPPPQSSDWFWIVALPLAALIGWGVWASVKIIITSVRGRDR
jgi:hypothetical protein